MSVDISFLLPTNRPPEYAQSVIDSINSLDSDYSYEICLYSKQNISASHITWYEEKEGLGPIAAFNNMVKNCNGQYIYILVDDHIVDPNVLSAIDFLNSDIFQDRKYKIITLSPGENNFARIPIKGDSWCGGITVNYDVEPYTTMRFPVVTKDTIKLLNNHIFHPIFKYHAGDLWLGYYLGVNGESGIQYEGANIREYINLRNHQYEMDDCRKYHGLVSKHRIGYPHYV